ncbi:MAG: MBL fold metallo-hydrolase [Planctomycetota bacterium]
MEATQALQPDLFGPPGTAMRFVPAPPAPVKSGSRPKPPPLSVCVLGSGSGGNASVLRPSADGGGRPVLIDAGFGPRTTAQRLERAGLTLAELGAVYVTHFDTDHFRPSWVRAIVDLKLRLRCHRWHLPDLRRVRDNQRLFVAGLVEPFDDGPFVDGGLTVCPIRLQHDRQGTIGYRFEYGGASLGYATDLGHAPEALCRHFAGVDVLCLESNYDERMTKDCPRPAFVNRRNLSDSGHLSNDQALAAVRRIGELSAHGNPRRVVLLHRSAQCNHPTKVRRCFAQDPAIARRLVLTDQRRRSRWVGVTPLRAVRRAQLTLAHCG